MNYKVAERTWYTAWDDISQEQIQQWILAIPYHIQEVIRLERGNEYKEGVRGFKRSWAGIRVKGKLSKLQFKDKKAQHQVVEDRENSDGEDDEHYSDVESEEE